MPSIGAVLSTLKRLLMKHLALLQQIQFLFLEPAEGDDDDDDDTESSEESETESEGSDGMEFLTSSWLV
jgi:hypothetical protein